MRRPQEPTERLRISRACTTCVARKVKCDGTELCSTCRSVQSPCFYLPLRCKRGPPKGCPARGGVKKKVKPAGEQGGVSAAAQKDNVASSSSSAAQTSASSPHIAPALLMRAEQQSSVDSPTFHWNDDTLYAADAAATAAAAAVFTQADASNDDVAAATVRTYDGASSDASSSSCDVKPSPTPPAATRPLPFAPRSPSLSALSTTDRGPGRLLPEPIVDSLLLIYETFIHPHWPMVYMPALRSLRTLDTQSPLLFDAILAGAAAIFDAKRDLGGIPYGGDNDEEHHKILVAIGEEMLESVRRRIFARGLDKGDLETVQSLVLASLVDLGHGRLSSAYQMGGMACRMACDLGLNMNDDDTGSAQQSTNNKSSRSDDDDNDDDPAKREERRRTVWVCYTLDKMLSAISQRPMALRASDIAASRPSTLERDELELLVVGDTIQQRFMQSTSTATQTTTTTTKYVKSHALSTFNALCDVMVILESTLARLYSPTAINARLCAAKGKRVKHTLSFDEQERLVAQMDDRLSQWRAALPTHLQWSVDDVKSYVPPHILTVRGWYHTCKILVHRARVPHLYYQTTKSGCSEDVHAVEALRSLKQADVRSSNDVGSSALTKLDGLDVARDAATSLCRLMEAYETTLKVRRYSGSWVYLMYQAGTVHAGLALPSSSPSSSPAPSQQLVRTSALRLKQCIRWMEHIAATWCGASQNVKMLRMLSEVSAGGALTPRVPSRCATPRPPPHDDLATRTLAAALAMLDATPSSMTFVNTLFDPSMMSCSSSSPPPLQAQVQSDSSAWIAEMRSRSPSPTANEVDGATPPPKFFSPSSTLFWEAFPNHSASVGGEGGGGEEQWQHESVSWLR